MNRPEIYLFLCCVLVLISSSVRRVFSSEALWRRPGPPDAEGTVDDEQYYVEHFTEDTATVSLKVEKEIPQRLEAYAPYDAVLQVYPDAREVIGGLIKMRVPYIDIGFRALWIAAEVPYAAMPGLSEPPHIVHKKVARALAQLKRMMFSAEPSAEAAKTADETKGTSVVTPRP